MNQILLSIVVPTYNRLHELQTMLDSLLPQVLGKPVEILIAEDCSTDPTWEWLQSRFAGASDIHVLRTEKNGGPGPARNLCLSAARGEYFLPIDSDFILMEGAIDSVLAAIQENGKYRLLFFPCIQYPAVRRLGSLTGRCEISFESFVADQLGEMIPVSSLSWLRTVGLSFPRLRAGGEGLLWAEILANGPALFVDIPIVLYRTDVKGRICTLEYQLENAGAMAETTDAMIELLARSPSARLRPVRAQRYLAAGTYHLLSGNTRAGWRRLFSAMSMGSLQAVAALVVSLGGKDLFTRLFRIYRTRFAKAYL